MVPQDTSPVAEDTPPGEREHHLTFVQQRFWSRYRRWWQWQQEAQAQHGARTQTSQLTGSENRSMFVSSNRYVKVVDLLFFNGCRSLLRASKLTTIMQDGGALLRVTGTTDNTYELSDRVDRIDAFLSHNWTAWWVHKYLCLCVHFYFRSSLVIFMTIEVIFASICFLVSAPQWVSRVLEILSLPLFLFILLRCQRIRAYAGIGVPTVFLDKACIDQENKDIQRASIYKLGAFLNASSTMVAIYSDVYLQRLWTVYEMATWVCLKPLENMIIIPEFVPWVVGAALSVPWTAHALVILRDGISENNNTALEEQLIGTFISGQVLLFMCRRFARRQLDFYSSLADFNVNESKCADESDRPMVYDSIAAIMRAMGLTTSHGSRDDALEAFNSLVRTRLPTAVQKSLGKHLGLQYIHLLACAVLPRLHGIFYFNIPSILRTNWLSCYTGKAEPGTCSEGELAILNILLWTIVEPIRLAVMVRWSMSCLRCRGCCGIIYVECIWVIFLVVLVTALVSIKFIAWYNYLLAILIGCFVSRCTFGGPFWCAAGKRLAEPVMVGSSSMLTDGASMQPPHPHPPPFQSKSGLTEVTSVGSKQSPYSKNTRLGTQLSVPSQLGMLTASTTNSVSFLT